MTLKKLFLAATAVALTVAATHTATASTCPRPRPSSADCPQVTVWAQDPDTGICCSYGTYCAAPIGWNLYIGAGCTGGPYNPPS